jgi:uncharacterized protein YggU (UPF0235/DUF167 family)
VIRGNASQAKAFEETIEYIDEQLEVAEEDFEIREKQLAREKAILDEM